MLAPSFSVCREGVVYIAFTALCTLAFAALGWAIPAVVMLGLTAFTMNFFRDPERIPPEDEACAVAPADGKVIIVGPHPDPLTGETRIRVCIFMNVFNVHVNRMPMDGTIERISYFPGKFINASFDKASEDNERNAVGFSDADGNLWTMVQIAGLIARRIVMWGEKGDRIGRGRRFGMIKFGSRVDVYLPSDYDPSVSVGQKVYAGQTPLARKSS